MSYKTDSFDDEVVSILRSGGAGFMPSDTVYGLSVRAMDEAAVQKLHAVKLRDEGKPFIILVSNPDQLHTLGVDSSLGERLMNNFWPGPLTIVLPAPAAPRWLTQGLDTLAVRLPDDKELINLIDQVGPIVSTSANESGAPIIDTADEAIKTFDDRLDFYVDAGELPARQPSTIVKPTASGIEILRQGAVRINI
ncbi:MAG TPA: L-threonylcarbamoyladenylate synthase [Candidatus Saccharimonadales bacterium]|nr:L-threonylcarbamoyladenylate synthase [Candidatus Saccharimonadales bacterium]